MTPQQAREQIGFALTRAAPGSDIDTIDPDTDLRDALDLDSLDFLRFIEILSETSGRRIEEDDYPELATLDSSIRFLAARLPPGGPMIGIQPKRIGQVRALPPVISCASAGGAERHRSRPAAPRPHGREPRSLAGRPGRASGCCSSGCPPEG